MSTGIFVISLDFELHWGAVEKWPLPAYRSYFDNTRAAIPQMLELFSAHEVHATWATVGFLFHNTFQELVANMPTLQPNYADKTLSAYHFIGEVGLGMDERDDPYHFAPSLIRKIMATEGQEMGTHTYSHYYCNEPRQTLESFREDLLAAKRAALNYGIELKSLVFPRNQFNEAYLKVCQSLGIRSVRSNPKAWFWDIDTGNESRWKRLVRGLDAFIPLSRNSYPLEMVNARDGEPHNIPASRFLRPYNVRFGLLNDLRINRILNEMKYAAEHNEVYHLWWHPHNFGAYPKQSLDNLRTILNFYSKMKLLHGMRSMNMGELVHEVIKHAR